MAASRMLVRMPSALKRALAREVSRRQGTMNDVAVSILAERFGVEFTSGRRGGSTPGASGAVLLRVPPPLKAALKDEADRSASTTNQLIVMTLDRSASTGKDAMASTNGKTNGRARPEDKVRAAVIGVGNRANSLLQGVEYYKDADPDAFVPSLMHVDLGGYHIRDVEFTAAFDVTTDKVGKDLADAIWAHPNDTYNADVPKTGITVSRGMTHDGLGAAISEVVEKAPWHRRRRRDPQGDEHRRRRQLPPGRLRGGERRYTEQILKARSSMRNCMPVFIARAATSKAVRAARPADHR